MTQWFTVTGQFALTAIAEILGCYCAYIVVKNNAAKYWLLVGASSLAVFAWLLTLHPTGRAGRIYAAYGVSWAENLNGCDFVACGITLLPPSQLFFDYRCQNCSHHGRYTLALNAEVGDMLDTLKKQIEEQAPPRRAKIFPLRLPE